jgi:L-serine deaminase
MDKPHFYVQAIDAAPAGGAWVVRGLVAGANVLSPADIKAMQDAVERELNQQVDLKILSRVEL